MSVCILLWVQSGWDKFFEMSHDQSFKALHNHWGECNRPIVIWACYSGRVCHWGDGGGFEAHWDDRLLKGNVKNVCKNISQLEGTFLEDTPGNASGPAALRGFTLRRVFLTSLEKTDSTLSPGGGG